ncbi:hypothetical protein GCM10022270_06150 [Terriglobus aquaticus]
MNADAPVFQTADARWQAGYDHALRVLAGNVQRLPNYKDVVLIEGAVYPGIWQECGPHESLVYRRFRPEVARASHMVFFDKQRNDGQLPANHKRTETGFGQTQMVVPIAATAWELAAATRDEEFLHTAYTACSGWDGWLSQYRNTRATGLVEGFCTYDTGMDNSPRWKGIPNQCPGKDAKRFPEGYKLPRLCPDLSATVYGGRVALAEMARALGRPSEAQQCQDRAERLRALILKRLYVPEDAAFYDLDADDKFVRVDCDILSRMCGEHVVEQKLFETLWARQFSDPKKFWAPYPLPSVALDDPQFVRPIPRNSWGGATQALTALRTPQWMDHYGRSAEFAHLANQWCEAILREGDFRQQMDPVSGVFSHEDSGGYSPAALVMVDFTWRLAGIVETPGEVQWNVRPGCAASNGASFRMRSDSGAMLDLSYAADGATLRRNGREIARLTGGTARVITDPNGTPTALLGIHAEAQAVTFQQGRHKRHYTLRANERVLLKA